MSNQLEKRKLRWEKLNNMPTDVVKTCASLVERMGDKESKRLFELLAGCDTDDLAKLAKCLDGGVGEVYTQVKAESDQEDIIHHIRQYIVENPLDVSGDIQGIAYTVKADASSLCRLKDSRFGVELMLPYEVTLSFDNKSVTMSGTFNNSVKKKVPKNGKIETVWSNQMVHDTAMLWPTRGFKRTDLTTGPGKEWRSVHLEVINMLKDHHVGQQFRQATSGMRLFDGAFQRFGSHLLPLVRDLMLLHGGFSYEIVEDDEIAFIFDNELFIVFTKIKGIYYISDLHNRSPLYDKLELARQLRG